MRNKKLISRRAYENSREPEDVLSYLSDEKNHFDSTIVKHMIKAIDEILAIYKPENKRQYSEQSAGLNTQKPQNTYSRENTL